MNAHDLGVLVPDPFAYWLVRGGILCWFFRLWALRHDGRYHLGRCVGLGAEGSGQWRDFLRSQDFALVADQHAAVPALLDLDVEPGVAASLLPRKDLQGVPAVLQSIVLGYSSPFFEAEHPVNVQRRTQRTVSWLRLGRRDTKTLIET
jgi:hypothetical protein